MQKLIYQAEISSNLVWSSCRLALRTKSRQCQQPCKLFFFAHGHRCILLSLNPAANALYNRSAQDQKGQKQSFFLQNQCIFILFFLVFRLIFF